MSALPSKRQFLNSNTNPETGQPFAGLTRGRFSAAAEAFAAANTDKWAEAPVEVKAPRAPKAPKPSPAVSLAKTPASVTVNTPQVNPKEVRAWAKQNGHEVGERGRIHGTVVAAFLAAGGKAVVPAAARPTPLLMPRVRPQRTAWAVEPSRFAGRADTRIARTVCGSTGPKGPVGCRKPVESCTCSTGPVAPHWTSVSGQPMDLKPGV